MHSGLHIFFDLPPRSPPDRSGPGFVAIATLPGLQRFLWRRVKKVFVDRFAFCGILFLGCAKAVSKGRSMHFLSVLAGLD
jgi:hypothetical protein